MRGCSYSTRRVLNKLKRDYEAKDETRSMRRSKRKRVDGRDFELNSHVHASKKRRKDEPVWDTDYEQFLKALAKNGSDGVDYLDTRWMPDEIDHPDANLMEDDNDVNVNGRSADDGDDNVNINGRSAADDDVININGRFVDDDGINLEGRSAYDGNDIININGSSADDDINLNGTSVADGDDDANMFGRSADDINVNGQSLDDGLDGDDVDPQYKIFLENLREDGKSYILEIAQETGITELIKYEQEDGVGKRNKETLEIPVDLPKKKSSTVKKNPRLEVLDSVSGRRYGQCKERPGPYITNRPESYKYFAVKEKAEIGRTPKTVLKKGNRKMDSHHSSSHLRYKLNNESRTTKGRRPTKRPGSEVLHSLKRGRYCGAESDQTDDDYRSFLSHISVRNDEIMAYTPPNGRPLVFEPDVDSSSSLKIIREPQTQKTEVKNEPDDGDGSSIVMLDVDTGMRNQIRVIGRTKYREGLMKILKRPYDQEEYDKLFKEVKARKPMECDRELRNGIVTYPVEGALGKSYLQLYKAFSQKIDAAKGDCPTILNLLRGFFYWLTNIANEGMFMPWHDKACLEVLPELGEGGRLLPPPPDQKKRVRRHFY